jgi:hypothetical protein
MLVEFMVCPGTEYPTSDKLADPTTDARVSLQLEFKWWTLNGAIFLTQNKLLIELQNRATFDYHVAPRALA